MTMKYKNSSHLSPWMSFEKSKIGHWVKLFCDKCCMCVDNHHLLFTSYNTQPDFLSAVSAQSFFLEENALMPFQKGRNHRHRK